MMCFLIFVIKQKLVYLGQKCKSLNSFLKQINKMVTFEHIHLFIADFNITISARSPNRKDMIAYRQLISKESYHNFHVSTAPGAKLFCTLQHSVQTE